MPKRSYDLISRTRAPARRRVAASGGSGGRRGGSSAMANMARKFIKLVPGSRTGRLYTMLTQTKKKPAVRKLPDGVTTVSTFNKGYRLKSYYLPLLKTAAPSYQVIRNGIRLNSLINQHANLEIGILDAPFLSQVYANIVPNASSSNQRAFMEKMTMEVEMANSGDQILNLELYEVSCTKDTNTAALTTMGTGFTAMQASGQTLNNTTIGVTPFNAASLGQFWKIERVYKVAIPAGHIHKHTMTFSPRMIINELRRANATYYGGLSRAILLRTRGQPVTQQDNNSVVGIGPSALDVIFIGRAKVKYVAANTQTAWQFGPGTDFGAVVTAEAMDPVNDVVDTFTST